MALTDRRRTYSIGQLITIGLLLIQLATYVFHAGEINARVAEIERRLGRVEQWLDNHDGERMVPR